LNQRIFYFCLGCFFSLLSVTTFAVDSGQLLKQIEQEGNQIKPITTPPRVNPKDHVSPNTQGTKVVIKHFQFEGNTLITSAEIENYLSGYLNREITFDEISLGVNSIATLYQKKGFLAKASLPKQDITEGLVRVMIVEAKFGGAKFESDEKNTELHVKNDVMIGYIEANNRKGEALNLIRLDKSLLLLNELPGVALTSALEAGEGVGETAVLIKAKNKPWVNGSVILDNWGSHSTGGQRFLAVANIQSPLRIGDRGDITFLHSRGSDYGKIGYNLPIGYQGLRVGANTSYLAYDVVPEQDTGSLHPRGNATTYQLELSYPIYKAMETSLSVFSNYNQKYFLNKNDLGESSRNRNQLLALGLNGIQNNGWLKGGQTNALIEIDAGDLSRRNATDYANDQNQTSGARTDGRFNIAKLNLSHTQFILDQLSAVIKFNGQLADKNLDSSEKIYLGGPSGVRSYPANEGAGSSGYILNLEVRQELPYRTSVTGFYDFGYAKTYVDYASSIVTGSTRNSFNMQGYGVSLDWNGPYQTLLSGMFSKRIGNNPNPSASGADQNGGTHDYFFWLKGSVSF